jgi:hypothetical protein
VFLEEKVMKVLKKFSTISRLVAASVAATALMSCAATQTALEHHNLDSHSSLSKTIFLDPVSSSEKTIHVSVKNTSGKDLNIASQLEMALMGHGYRVVRNPNSAHYLLQANIVNLDKMSVVSSQRALGGGYGSAISGGVAGAGLAALAGNTEAIIGGSVGGGLVGLAADSLVKDVNYTLVTDVQISERLGHGMTMDEEFKSLLKNGSASSVQQVHSKKSDYQRYRTRVVSNAGRVNLSFNKARPVLEEGLVKTLAGLF